MRLDDLPRSQRVEDRRGQAGGGGFRVPGGRRGSLSLGSIVILLVIGWALGINPLTLIGGGRDAIGPEAARSNSSRSPLARQGADGAPTRRASSSRPCSEAPNRPE